MNAVERYLSEHYWTEDDLHREVRADTAKRGPSIEVSAEAGRLLALLVRLTGATRILEIGTLFGYSGIWMARELPPGGRLDTIEIEPLHADAAEHWFERAGVSDRVTVHRGAGVDVLATLPGPYDLAFIDADKESYPDYARLALERLRPGGLMVADNAIRGGRIVETDGDAGIEGIRMATTLPVGDGMAIAVKAFDVTEQPPSTHIG
jgi:predicted O-methyltransferase YrrM